MITIMMVLSMLGLGFLCGYLHRVKTETDLVKLAVRQHQLINDMSNIIMDQYVEMEKLLAMDTFYQENLNLLDKIIGAKER